MKTTITCSQSEACNIIKEVKNADEVVITENTSMNGYVEAILRVVRIEYPDTSKNKIAGIKRLRELVGSLSLYEAKVAIEHPDEAIMHYLKCGRPL